MKDTTEPLVAQRFLNNGVFRFRISQSVLTDNGPQFIAQLFHLVCTVLGEKRIPIAAYHTESNGQTERDNKSIAARPLQYVSYHKLHGIFIYSIFRMRTTPRSTKLLVRSHFIFPLRDKIPSMKPIQLDRLRYVNSEFESYMRPTLQHVR